MNNIPKLLSKSKLIRSYRCLKAFYMTVHHPGREVPVSEALQALFDQGNEVGQEARSLFPNGALISNPPWEFVQSAATTQELINRGEHTIYEAAFCYQNCYVRIDIIHYCVETKKWSLYEVKSSTRVKEDHIYDLGLQSWVIAKSGLAIDTINLVHLNRDCEFPDFSNLFTTTDVTKQIRENYLKIQPHLENSFRVLQQKQTPDVAIGEHCLSPGECGFKSYCWKENKIPSLSVLNLPTPKKWKYLKQDIINLNDKKLLTAKPELDKNIKRMLECHNENKRFVDAKAIKDSLSTWKYPLIFLDFETVNPAIPKFKGCAPYSQVPFQFSVHILRDKDATLEHHEFLHDESSDPRPTLIKELLKFCEKQGSLVAYYSAFENKVIESLAKNFPQYEQDLLSLVKRMQDPLPILRKSFYDPTFNMSYSLKSVAPALLGQEHSYDHLEIGDGYSAQRAYKKLISNKITKEEKKSLKENLLRYCKKDTELLAEITKLLFKIT